MFVKKVQVYYKMDMRVTYDFKRKNYYHMKPLSRCNFLYICTVYVFMCINNYVSV